MNENNYQANIGQAPVGQQPMGQPQVGYGTQPMMNQAPAGQMPMGQAPMGYAGQPMMNQVPAGQMPVGQAPMGYGAQPMMNQAPGGQMPMGQAPMGYGAQPMMNRAPVGQMPMGRAPMGYGAQPMMNQVPVGQMPMGQPQMGYAGQPMMGQQPMGNPYVAAPQVPFQGAGNREHVKTQDEVQNDPKLEQKVIDVMKSPVMLAFAVVMSLQIVCMIASFVLKNGFVVIGVIVPYLMILVASWIIWGTAKKGKPVAGGPILLKVQSIICIVSMGGVIMFLLFCGLLFLIDPIQVAEVIDIFVNGIFKIRSNLSYFGEMSGWVFFLIGAIPTALFIILQARIIVTTNIMSSAIKKKISKKPNTIFTLVMSVIFALLSGVVTGIYIYMISKAIIVAEFIVFAVSLALNVVIFGLFAVMLIMLMHEHDDDWY
ncbi:MAG: hypothetical protein MJ104_03520 [Lachnospiraceae bacterium]|nr:hypothetical protein [Lachnospiraceae bacterium]